MCPVHIMYEHIPAHTVRAHICSPAYGKLLNYLAGRALRPINLPVTIFFFFSPLVASCCPSGYDNYHMNSMSSVWFQERTFVACHTPFVLSVFSPSNYPMKAQKMTLKQLPSNIGQNVKIPPKNPPKNSTQRWSDSMAVCLAAHNCTNSVPNSYNAVIALSLSLKN